MFYSASVYFIHLYILILCTTYFSNANSVTWFEDFPGNFTRYRRQSACVRPQYECGSGECISENLVCDGKEDCRDGIDENNCEHIPCNNRFLFKCKYGACISKQGVCNGIKDCKDNSDEETPGCTTSTSDNCGTGKDKCDSGDCIDETLICDGKADCSDKSDETNKRCGHIICPRTTFRCKYGACVSKSKRCNGAQDCADGSDEVGCTNIKPITEPVTPTRPPVTPPVTPSGPPPTGSCLMPNNPPNGVYTVGGAPPGTFKPGVYVNPFQALVPQCNRGYNPTPPDKSFSFCTNGIWNPEPLKCAPSCLGVNSTKTTKITCTFQGRAMESCNNPVEDTQATISCEPLHEEASLAQSTPIRVCRDGSWDRSFPECYPICGQKHPEGTPNIIGGKVAKQGDYPWHVGIFDANTKNNLCGGSILNDRVIISAAHCFTDLGTGEKLPKENYLVAAGKYYRGYDDPRDKYVQYSTILDIYIPVRYKGDVSQYEGDLAIVKLTTKLTFTTAVQPVCMDWHTAFEYQQISGNKHGVVIGWGQTVEGDKPSEELKELSIPVIPYEQCFEQVPTSFRKFLTYDKVCAGFLGNATAACQGDSGGGLTFPYINDRYYIRGIVSTSPATAERNCDSNQYGTYTLVSKYIDFIKLYGL